MTNILIVEDNPLNRELVEAILDANGYTPVSVDNGAEAVELAKSTLPDLILMDINMVGIDGHRALALLREDDLTREIPVIAITGNATHADRDKMVASGFTDIVIKPFTVDAILESIQRVLEPD